MNDNYSCKYSVHLIASNVAKVGMKLFISSWNAHSIPNNRSQISFNNKDQEQLLHLLIHWSYHQQMMQSNSTDNKVDTLQTLTLL